VTAHEAGGMDLFNNREIALAVWFVIALIFCVSKPSIRSAFKSVLEALFNQRIVTHFLFMMSYIAFLVFFLWMIDAWGLRQLKNTIYWSLSVGAVTLFRISRISKDNTYIQNAIRDNLKIVCIIEFIAVF
jgi:hypothetical protein